MDAARSAGSSTDPSLAPASPSSEAASPSEPWPARVEGRPRRAALSGFGFGGINTHLLLEEWTGGEAAASSVATPGPVAIVGLAATAGHDADSVYLRALGSGAHQVALAAAQALKGTPNPAALASLLDAFDGLARFEFGFDDVEIVPLIGAGLLGDGVNDGREVGMEDAEAHGIHRSGNARDGDKCRG